MKTKILAIILIIVINVIFLNINVVQADGMADVITGGDSFLEAGQGNIAIDEEKVPDISSSLYNILLILGICSAVIIAAILGIQFMLGSVEEKAKVKDSLIPVVVGCVVVFGAFGIWKMFVEIGNSVSDKTQTEIVADFVRVDGKLYEKGRLYCKNCKSLISESSISDGYIQCHQCWKRYNITCHQCGKTLGYNEIVNGKCTGRRNSQC